MTGPFTEFAERIQAARAALEDVLAQADQNLSRFSRDNRPTEEERRELHQAALRGDLGDDMRELAEHIDRGTDSWDAVFAGESPNAGLLSSHLQRTIAENQRSVAEALERDEDFDLDRLRRDAEEP